MKKDVIRYMALPGFIPRLKGLFSSGFQYVPYFVALVYGAVRLLPAHHPYLRSSNMGKFGLRHVIAEALSHLVFSWRSLDQIILFFSVLIGLVMIFMQILLLAGALFIQPVMAGFPTNFAGFFLTPGPGGLGVPDPQDISHIMLDMVFGVPGIFDSCVSLNVACLDGEGNPITSSAGAGAISWGMEAANFPMAIHMGLHQMFQVYSLGLLVVATMIMTYFIVTILFETMQSGTAFGKRYNHVWAPIRMVVAFGLLVPVGYGLNSSQYIVLYAAKFGSGFATNGWALFNMELNNAHGGAYKSLMADIDASANTLVAMPKIPEIGGLLQFLSSALACKHGEEIARPQLGPIEAWLVKDPLAANPSIKVPPNGSGNAYQAMITFVNGASLVKIRFGRRNKKTNGKYAGWVKPTCGELVIKLSDSRPVNATAPNNPQELAPRIMQELYYAIIRDFWHLPASADFMTKDFVLARWPGATPSGPVPPSSTQVGVIVQLYIDAIKFTVAGPPGRSFLTTFITAAIPPGGAIEAMEQSGRWDLNPILASKGWAGAAIWYNKIAEMNGAMSSAILNIPTPVKFPGVMENVYEEKRKAKGDTNFTRRFDPTPGSGEDITYEKATDLPLAQAYWDVYSYWEQGGVMESPHARPTGNAMLDVLNALMGTSGLFSMRENPDLHPLAQLSGVGRALVEASIRNLTNAAIGGASGAFLGQVSNFVGVSAATFSGFLVSMSMIALTAGFILFYIVPFLPFIYFSFAFGGWVKGIFEAMVGAPLWALAHIRIDGQGLSGQSALTGYFLIFEIFLRPILMIFGLLASISIFAALVNVLNLVFDLVVSNVGGFDVETELTNVVAPKISEMRGAIDEFFFTVIYVIVVYLMGMSSFKLIDLIPNNILRWMGQSITTFNDSQENAAEKLVGSATQGAQQASQAIGGGLQSLASLGGKG